MAKEKKTDNKKENDSNSLFNNRFFKKQMTNINNLIGQSNLSMYGTDRTSDIDGLNATFQSLLNDHIGDLTNRNDGDITSFLSRVVSSDNKSNASDELIANQFMSMTGSEFGTLQSFIYDAYKNRLIEQSDLHEVSSQLIELSEAILITRDAIITADIVDGRMNRNITFTDMDEDEIENSVSIVEKMEEKFDLLNKIKNFIIPKTLEYGEYYVYVVPYSKLFQDCMRTKESMGGYGDKFYRESTIMESFNSHETRKEALKDEDSFEYFIEKAYEEFNKQETTKYDKSGSTNTNKISKEDFRKDMKNIMENINICNDDVPLPFLEEGIDSIRYFKEQTEAYTTEEKGDFFNSIANASITKDGISFSKKKTSKKDSDFSDLSGCYVKLIDPTRIIPIKIMNTKIGYYYIQDEDITPISGAVSSTLYFTKFDEHSREHSVISTIAERVVKAFDKPFLKKNMKFKQAIVDCFSFYNLNEKRLKFQFIPADYIQEFKIDEDVEGNGTSMIKKSLFYAKLYLMLLLFKIMSIILNSNDTKVNYIKQSGIDKDVANKVQEIARIRQSRQINITDLFSYTTLINKVGNGSELYIPVGRSGERPIETEILSGQDVQLNNDLMEMLKNSYILGTGVPAAIVNYMQEADFAKVVEQNNTKFNGRVVNYQLDFNPSITALYKKIIKWSTNIPENVYENFVFTLQPPKTAAFNSKSEIIGQFSTLSDFLVQLMYDDPNASPNPDMLNKEIREFKKIFVEEQLPMINMSKVKEMYEKAKLETKRVMFKPDASNGDNGNDLSLDDELNNVEV